MVKHKCYFSDNSHSGINDAQISTIESIKANYPTSLDNVDHLKALRSDKILFILINWSIDFPGNKITDFNKFQLLMERSRSVQQWYKVVIGKFAQLNEMPDWILETKALREHWGFENNKAYEALKRDLVALNRQKKDLSTKYSKDMLSLEKQSNDVSLQWFKAHPLLAINKIPVQALDPEISIKHAGLSSSDLDDKLDQELAIYKSKLAKDYVNGNLNIEELLEILKSKMFSELI